MNHTAAIAIILLLISLVSVADDSLLQEKKYDLLLGRVFLTAAERRHLDKKRRASVIGTVTSNATSPPQKIDKPKPRKPHAAGYIISPRGTLSRWKEGDFHSSDSDTASDTVLFPGDVSIESGVERASSVSTPVTEDVSNESDSKETRDVDKRDEPER